MKFSFTPNNSVQEVPQQYQGQDQQEGNWTLLDVWNLLTINLKDKSFHNSKVLKSGWNLSFGKKFQIYTVQITRKFICETFLPSLHDQISDPM